MYRLETREMLYFVAVAEELHFSRAAARLEIAQPPLSRAIARLESRLGVRLLERTSRHVELTAAGSVLLDECRRLLQSMDAAVLRARRTAQPSPLVVAVRPGTGSGLLADILQEVHDAGVVFSHDPGACLRDGTADIALLCTRVDDFAGLRTARVSEQPPVAILPRDHHLARLLSVTEAELREDPRYEDECSRSRAEVFDRVAIGRLVTVITAAHAPSSIPDTVVAVPVTDKPLTIIAFCWLEGASRPDIDGFASVVRRLVTEHDA